MGHLLVNQKGLSREVLSNMVASSHLWQLSPWHAASLNCDVLLSMKYTPEFEDLFEEIDAYIINDFKTGNI